MNSFLALGVAFTLLAPAPKDAPKKAPPAIVGEWECVEFTGGGRTATPIEMKEIGYIGYEFTAEGKFRMRKRDEVTSEGTYNFDSSKDPAELNVIVAKNGRFAASIYKVEKDTLILCSAEGGKDRPTKFESPAGTRIILMKLKRVEKKKE